MGAQTAVIVDAVRTPVGRRGGALAGWHPVDLAATVLRALSDRNGLDPSMVEDVMMGCVVQVGNQAGNVARSAVLAAGWPESVPGTTIDRQCGSSQQAAHFAAQAVMAGVNDIVVAGGVEVMSTTPMNASVIPGSFPMGPSVFARYAEVESYGQRGLVSQGIGAELIADAWNLSREDLDSYSARSHALAAGAQEKRAFQDELVPVAARRLVDENGTMSVVEGEEVTADEGVRPGTTVEVLSGLRSAFREGGKVTAGSSSQISDGAAALLIMSERRANQLGLRPLARFHSFAVAGSDPVKMATGPIPATQQVLQRAGLAIDDIDHFEINEAFAPVALAWQKELRADPDRVNPRGGAIAIGHPLGGSGARLMTTMVHALLQTGGRYGLQSMCEGGGMANATVIERLG